MQEKKQKVSPLKQRILHFVDFLDISKREFYNKTSISRGTLESNTGITEETLAKIFATFDELNINWVFTGEGQMLKSDFPHIATKANDRSEGIPLIPITAMAGAFSQDRQVLELECERFVVPTFKGADFLIAVKGSSMYPKYSSGDIVACKRLPIDTFFQWNKVYVLDTDQGALIKRVSKANKPDLILIVSENIKYEPFELNRSQIYNIALVLGVIRLE
jgi:phage repressor protein C with HTH and peptisase S24 domain